MLVRTVSDLESGAVLFCGKNQKEKAEKKQKKKEWKSIILYGKAEWDVGRER